MEIQVTTTKQTKVSNKWITSETETQNIDFKKYDLITSKETLQWFRRCGGTETATKEYTSRGYKIVKLVSTCPLKVIRTIRTFSFN